jgi:hypothetical protein
LLVVFISGVGFCLLTGPMLVGYMRMIKTEDEGGAIEIADRGQCAAVCFRVPDRHALPGQS